MARQGILPETKTKGGQAVLYHAYEFQRALLSGASAMAEIAAEFLTNPAYPFGYLGTSPYIASALEVFAHAYAPRGKPEFGITTVYCEGDEHEVEESVVYSKPFCGLRRFRRAGLPDTAAKLLIVAPMSGHYATLLRGTVARMAESQEVYVTDWADAKMVPLDKGPFDLDDYIDYLIEFLAFLGPDTHVLAVCQPSVPAFAATAIMAEQNHPCRPASLIMMGGPVDTRASPTAVNDVAQDRPLSWFQNNVIATVPMTYPGGGRKVYPGFLQLAGFLSMNLGSHIMSHYQLFNHLIEGDGDGAAAHKAFYDEYLSVCDMTEEFYLQTIRHVFIEHSLPRGLFVHRGKAIDPHAIVDTALFAIEGERDDISGIGQTHAALDLASRLPDSKKKYLLAPDVGHYGIFNGSKWRMKIAPLVEDFIRTHRHVGEAADFRKVEPLPLPRFQTGSRKSS